MHDFGYYDLAYCGMTALGVVVRPFRWPEAVWAVAGAAMLLLLNIIGWSDAVSGVLKGFDVYLFLIGMMLLSELARREGLFDWIAAIATSAAKGLAAPSILSGLRSRRGRHGLSVK